MAKILLAEDDLFLRDIYTEILKSEGFEVTSAIDGEETLLQIKKGGWDLVLLDVIMPKLTGVEVLKKLKGMKPRSLAKHIVFMSNTDDIKSLEEVVDMTDGHFLKSAITPGQLVDRIKNMLQK